MKAKIMRAIIANKDLAHYTIDIDISSDYIVTLNGEVDEWQHVVNIGHIVAKVKGVRNVVNDIKARGITIPKKDNSAKIKKTLEEVHHKECDVVIIGAGISGCAIARELSKYKLKVVVVEKNSDIAEEATKANNGNIHPGILAKPGTLKAKLNLKGNKMYTKLAEELHFELKRTGSLNIVYDKSEWRKMLVLKFLKKSLLGYLVKPLRQFMKVPGLKWLTGEEVIKLEPNVKVKPLGGLLMTTMGLVEPYEVCIALAEDAAMNGVTFMLETEALDVMTEDGKITGIITDKCVINSTYVVNSAGVYADDIAKMAGDQFFTIHPRRGAIAIIDKNRKGFLKIPAGSVGSNRSSNKNTKGGGASITPEGNMLWGPTAIEIPYKEDKSVEASDIDYIEKLGRSITDEVKRSEIITYFAGIRAADYMEDFIIGMSGKVRGFINVAGIQSPGLASAPAIAEMVEGIIRKDRGTLIKNESYNPIREEKVEFRKLSHEEQDALIKKNPKYGNIICRCELITEGEIVDALHSPIPVMTMDAVKRRTRAGMGRCQGGFCGPKVLQIIARELGMDPTEVTLKGWGSYVLNKENR